jgi:hypothetical protein
MTAMEMSECEYRDDFGDQAYGDGFEGDSFAYAISSTESFHVYCHYKMECKLELPIGGSGHPNGTRAHREMQRARGKKISVVPASALRDELLLIPGVGMSAGELVAALRRFIELVEKDGMFIGLYKRNYLKEKADGSITTEPSGG